DGNKSRPRRRGRDRRGQDSAPRLRGEGRGGGRQQDPALDAGVRMLARRAHSRAELRLKLRRRGYQPGEIEEALTRLTELGYIDDEAFARALAGRPSGQRG